MDNYNHEGHEEHEEDIIKPAVPIMHT